MRFKKFGTTLGAALVAAGAFAQGIGVNIDGQPVNFTGVGPQKVEGRVLVPVRGIFEALGAYVGYDPVKRIVTATKGDVDITLGLGQKQAVVNGRQVTLDVPAQIVRGSTMVPLRFIGEALGAEVTWDNATQKVNIATSGGNQGGNTGGNTGGGVVTPTDTAVNIQSFGSDADAPLKAGSSVVFTLVGTPKGQATFQIPGVTGEVPMREVANGRYEAVLKVESVAGKPVHVADASPIARLRVGHVEKMIQSGNPITIDTGLVRVMDVTPLPDSRSGTTRPNVTATFDEAGTGVNVNTVRVYIDNVDVTADATINRNFMAYKPSAALKAGKHAVKVVAADLAGNVTTRTWSFEIVGTAEVVKSVVLDAPADPQPGDVVTVTAVGAPGGTATFDLGEGKTGLKMTETTAGKYVGEYTIRRGDVFRNDKVLVKLRTKTGEVFTTEAPKTLGVRVGPPAAPKFTTAADAAIVNGQIVIKGKAEPKTRVKVRVDYRASLLGVLGYNGTLGEQTVETDAVGNFVTEPFKMDSLGGGKDATYTVTAVAIGENDEESVAATLKIVKK